MSRYYQMDVVVKGTSEEKRAKIAAAMNSEWQFEDVAQYNGQLTATGTGNLCGGETEEEFAGRLADAIWAANDEYCYIEVSATCLDDLPYETHILDEEAYEARKKAAQG
jgi:hypothetical protein